MAQAVLKNRVKETTITTGAGAVTLAGAAAGFQSFNAAHSNGDKVYYTIEGGSEWEVGVGTFTSSGTTLSRDTVLASSNAGALVNFSSGSKNVFSTLPADRVGIKLGTPQVSTSGASIDFTGIPAGVKKIVISFAGVSTTGTNIPIVQLGDAGGIEATGYLGSGGNNSGDTTTNQTVGFGVAGSWNSSVIVHGCVTLQLLDSSTFTWAAFGILGISNTTQITMVGGSKSLSAELDRVRITTVGGADTFDAGTINISYII
jgi:hypothetical protein